MDQKLSLGFLIGLLLLSLALRLGYNPLYMEEPRRALVGLEMELNGNLLVPTQMGEFYYKKPPVFNWVMLGSFHLFGYNETAARLVSLLSFFLIGGIHFAFVRKYHSYRLAVISSFLFLVSVDLLYTASYLAEIDIFYSLICYLGFIAIYHFDQKQRYGLLFLSVYGLAAIGALTKGFPSLVFPVLSIGAYFLYQRRWKMLFHPWHFAGVALFCLIVGGYFWAYTQYNSLEGYFHDLWKQSGSRTAAGYGIGKNLLHVLKFPGLFLTDMLPGSLFLIFILKKGRLKKAISTPLVQFALLLFLANMLPYWISPGVRSRYIYMMYPLLATVLGWLYLEYGASLPWLSKLFRIFSLSVMGILALALVAPFLPQLAKYQSEMLWPSILAFLVTVGTFAFFWKPRQEPIFALFALLLVGRLWFGAIVLPIRAIEGEHHGFKENGLKVAELSKGQDLYIWQHKDDGEISLSTVFYIERERQQVLGMKYEKDCQSLFLAHDRELTEHQVEVIYEFDSRLDHYYLFKFKDCP